MTEAVLVASATALVTGLVSVGGSKATELIAPENDDDLAQLAQEARQDARDTLRQARRDGAGEAVLLVMVKGIARGDRELQQQDYDEALNAYNAADLAAERDPLALPYG